MDLSLLVVAAVLGLLLLIWLRPSERNLPPCPVKGLPLVGHVFSLNGDVRLLFQNWRNQCGDIFRFQVGGTMVIVLNGYDLIKEALVKKADIFTDRPAYFFDRASGMSNTGVLFARGETWKEQRSVCNSILRSFGMGKNLMAEKIQEEVSFFIAALADLKGEPTDIHKMIMISTANNISSLMLGHRFQYNDPDFLQIIAKMQALAYDQQNISLVNFIYWLKYVPGDLFGAKKLTSSMEGILDMMRKCKREKERDEVHAEDINNIIDAYIHEMNKLPPDSPTTLNDRNLVKIMWDLIMAGTETTSTSVNWFLVYILNHPHVQDKLFREIESVVGLSRPPNIQDKAKLHYLNATIAETLRLSSVVPLSLFHISTEETTLRDYTVPKDAFIIPNLDSVHHDPSVWGEDVYSFRPERFLDKEGRVNIPEQLIPFSTGRRICLGEPIAKVELILYIASIVQKFDIQPSTPAEIPPMSSKCGIISYPQLYKVRLVERV